MYVPKRINSLKLAFEDQKVLTRPSDMELYSFIRSNFVKGTVIGYYFDEHEHNYIIKLSSKCAMCLAPIGKYMFKFDSGNKTTVVLSKANDYCRRFRLLNVPLDINNEFVHTVISQYSTVVSLEHEMVGDDDWRICNGNRLCALQLTREMPEEVDIDGFVIKIRFNVDTSIDQNNNNRNKRHENLNLPVDKTKSSNNEDSFEERLNESDTWLQLIGKFNDLTRHHPGRRTFPPPQKLKNVTNCNKRNCSNRQVYHRIRLRFHSFNRCLDQRCS